LGKADRRALLTATGTIDRLRAEDVPRKILPHIRHIHAGSTGIQPRLRSGLPQLFRDARAAGVSSSFDTNWDPERRWEGIAPMLAAADIFFPNEREATLISGVDDPLAAAQALVAMAEAAGRDSGAGPLIVAVKLARRRRPCAVTKRWTACDRVRSSIHRRRRRLRRRLHLRHLAAAAGRVAGPGGRLRHARRAPSAAWTASHAEEAEALLWWQRKEAAQDSRSTDPPSRRRVSPLAPGQALLVERA
jgi:hypothetical protein